MDRRARIVAGALAALALLGAALTVSPRAVLSRLDWLAADPWRFAAALLVLAAVRPLLAWPTTLLAVLVGYGYGIAAVPVALTLIVATSLPPYVLARRGRGDGRFSSAGERVVDAAGDLRSIVVTRLLPAPADVVSVGAGVAGVGVWPFVLGTAVGETPWALAGVLAGASVDGIAEQGLAAAFDVRLVAAAALVALGLSFGPFYRWLRERAD